MVKNLFSNRGGLHNRVTCRIRLLPFTLGECERYARENGLAMSRKELAEAYMALGGIPYYWHYLDKRFSLAQNLDRMFFVDDAPLANEFRELFAPVLTVNKVKKVLAIRTNLWFDSKNNHASGIGEARFVE